MRKYEVHHAETGKLIAKAETNWAFVERETGRLIPIPEAVSGAFKIWQPEEHLEKAKTLRNQAKANKLSMKEIDEFKNEERR